MRERENGEERGIVIAYHLDSNNMLVKAVAAGSYGLACIQSWGLIAKPLLR